MERKFDPMTGEPIYEQKFDPMTGQPINQRRFDPKTGQPIGQQKFDPMTGKPIMEKRFDPKTGKPLKGGPKSKKKGGLIAIIAAAAVILIAVGIFAVVKSGMFLSAPNKVLLAASNTFTETTPLLENLTGLELLNEEEFTVDVSCEIEEGAISATVVNGKDEKQVAATLDIPDVPEIEMVAGLDDEYVKLQIPSFSDDVLAYNYTKEKTGFLADNVDQMYLDMVDEMIAMVYEGNDTEEITKDLKELFTSEYEKLDFEKVDKEEFEINDKDVKCKGYETTISEDTLLDLIDGIEDIYNEYYGGSSELMYEMTGDTTEELFDEMRYSFEGMPDMDITFYIYKNKLACINMDVDGSEAEIRFLGGDIRMQNMEIAADGETVLEIKGKTDGSEETIRMYSYDMEMLKLEYESKSGEYTLDIGEGSVYVEGVLTSDKKELTLAIDTLEEYGYSYGSGSITVSKGASAEKLSGELVDIGEASEAELMDIVMEYEELLNEMYYYY
ncbi:MAG: hypothetical protein J5983_02275 [Ruminococcus sp.]|nr:hypothetical protein [Ruminococcus sp.]